MAEIGLIVPVYKAEPYLHRCVDSILNQSYRDFQLVLVDDGSPDRCGQICEEYAQKDSRIHVIHQKNKGISGARNAGLEWVLSNTDAPWIAFADSDDWLHRDYLKILHQGTKLDMVDISMCHFHRTAQFCQDQQQEDAAFELYSPEEAYTCFYGICMPTYCKLYRRELFWHIRFPEDKSFDDPFTTHLLTFGANRIAVYSGALYHYYFNPESITRIKWNPKRMQQLQAHEERLTWLEENGCQAAWHRELEVYGDALLEQAQALLPLCREDKTLRPYLARIRRQLRRVLGMERQVGRLNFDQGRIWIYLTAWPAGPVRELARFAQKLKNHG